MQFTKLITNTLISTTILLGAVASSAIANPNQEAEACGSIVEEVHEEMGASSLEEAQKMTLEEKKNLQEKMVREIHKRRAECYQKLIQEQKEAAKQQLQEKKEQFYEKHNVDPK